MHTRPSYRSRCQSWYWMATLLVVDTMGRRTVKKHSRQSTDAGFKARIPGQVHVPSGLRGCPEQGDSVRKLFPAVARMRFHDDICYIYTPDLAQAVLSRSIKFVFRSYPLLFRADIVDFQVLESPLLEQACFLSRNQVAETAQ